MLCCICLSTLLANDKQKKKQIKSDSIIALFIPFQLHFIYCSMFNFFYLVVILVLRFLCAWQRKCVAWPGKGKRKRHDGIL